MYFRACCQVSCGCCSLGFVLGGTLTVLLVLYVMDSYTATKVDMTVVKQVIAGYSSTTAHSLLSEAFYTMISQRNTDQSETTIEQKTSEFSSVKYQTKDKRSIITKNKEEVQHFTLYEDINCLWHDVIGGKLAATPGVCAGKCEVTEGCMAFVYDKRGVNSRNCLCKSKCTSIKMMESINTYIKVIDHIGCSVFDGKRSCYHLSQSVGSFSEMIKYCKELNMQMVVLETWREYKFIEDQIKTDNMAMSIYVSMKLVTGHYAWIYPDGDTVQLDYGKQDPWAPKQPRYIQHHDCVYFWAIRLGKLDDFQCSYNRFTICEHY